MFGRLSRSAPATAHPDADTHRTLTVNCGEKRQAHAIEGSKYISASAEQAFLESEPHLRGPKEKYIKQYQELARNQLDQALEAWNAYCDGLGEKQSGTGTVPAALLKQHRLAMTAHVVKPSCN
ncbi:hypothetical protein MMC29_008371 [Sticta canariensis]|nr:hypothetical protein [Sticta canariensis]